MLIFSQITLPGEASCQESCPLLYREAHAARNWGLCLASSQGGKEALSPQIHEDLRLANNLVNELRSSPSPSWAFRWHWSHRQKLDSNLIRDLDSEPPPTGFLTLKNWEIIKLCYFKMLSVGIICYAEKYNSLRPQGCSLLAELERGWNKVNRREHGRWWGQRANREPAPMESNSNTLASKLNEVRIQSTEFWVAEWHDERTGLTGQTVQGSVECRRPTGSLLS